MTVAVTSDKASVLPGGSIVFTVKIQGEPNVSDITVTLGFRAAGSTTWIPVEDEIVNTDNDGYAETLFSMTIPSNQTLGYYEVRVRAEKGTFHEESTILTILVGEAPQIVLDLPTLCGIGLVVADAGLIALAVAVKAFGVELPRLF